MIPRIKKGVRARREEFGLLIFTNRTPILSMNTDAAAIWNLIDGCRSTADIASSIPQLEGDATKIACKVNEFIMSCIDLDIVELDAPDK